jgi:two-component system phosphate regulon sensor histidine kinase PhoR
MARFRAPANVMLRRAQLALMLAALIPTILMTAIGVIMLAVYSSETSLLVFGLLVVVFCTTAITGYILGSIFVARGASQARFQHDFLDSVSHELRTPLTSISLFIETLRDDRLTEPAEKRQCLDLLNREVDRLRGLVGRLLDLSRIEAGQAHFAMKPVAVADIVNDAVAALAAASLPDPVDIEVDVPAGLELIGDRGALAQAVNNLLLNAWKYTDPHGRVISVSARADGRFVDISVHDNGPGIPRSEQRRIFDRFERSRRDADEKKPGSGLGLAIVKGIARAHRGKIELRSTPGEGSEFRLKLRRQAT